jgi:hypothetical protein
MILNLPVASRTALSKKVLGAYDFASIGQLASCACCTVYKAKCPQLLPPASPRRPTGPGKQKTPRRAPSNCFIFLRKTGAGEAIRTLDPNLGKVVLYP